MTFEVALAEICRQVDGVVTRTCSVLRVSPVSRVSIQGSADLRTVLAMLAAHGERSLVFRPEVRGEVSVEIHNLPWDLAMESILVRENLRARAKGNLLVVSRAELVWGEPFVALTPPARTRAALGLAGHRPRR